MYVSFDDSARWSRMGGTLPVVPIYDLVRKDGDLVAATHGRSFRILEDVVLLHQLAAGERVDDQPRLFAPALAPRYPTFPLPEGEISGLGYGYTGPLVFGVRRKRLADGRLESRPLDDGENPPDGVVVRYWLPARPEGDVTLIFLDGQGGAIRSFRSKKEDPAPDGDAEPSREDAAPQAGQGAGEGPALGSPGAGERGEEQPAVGKEAGMNRFIWDMRATPARMVEGDTSTPPFLIGPMVLPGRYQVRLAVGDRSWMRPFEIVPDPRGHETAKDRQAQQGLCVSEILASIGSPPTSSAPYLPLRWRFLPDQRPIAPWKGGLPAAPTPLSCPGSHWRINSARDRGWLAFCGLRLPMLSNVVDAMVQSA